MFVILGALLAGPLILAPLEENLDLFCLVLGAIALTVARCWEWKLVSHALIAATPITLVVIAAGLLFGRFRHQLDDLFATMRRLLPRPAMVASSLIILALLSSVITAVVAALMLAEAVGLMGLAPPERTKVAVLGSFAIGLGAALTPLGEPLATIASAGLRLDFLGLFGLLAWWVLPAIAGLCALAGYQARGPYSLGASFVRSREGPAESIRQGLRVLAFVAGLIFIGKALAPLSSHYVGKLSNEALFWVNLASAALDNATLVAIEFHGIDLARARSALLSLLISGGMLIPGNVPNLVCAYQLGIRSREWAQVGVPVGFALLGIYFAALFFIV